MRGLNLCCGAAKIADCDNVDFNKQHEPDLHFDIRAVFPLESDTYDEVFLFHSIEHIERKYHMSIFREIHRVLKEGGTLYLSYPEFKHVAQFWIDNYRGMRDFWKDTIFGRQNDPLDFHVCPMDTEEVKQQLKDVGFLSIEHKTESPDVFNSVVRAIRGPKTPIYEEVLQADIQQLSVNLGDGLVFGDKLTA